ncbi:MAG: hypothetical protein ACTTJ6_03075 [Treponema sp.]
MFWEFVKSVLFFRLLYIAGGVSFLYLYAKNSSLFGFGDMYKEEKNLNSNIANIKKIKGASKAILVFKKNNDKLREECNWRKQKNTVLGNAISAWSKEKGVLENKKKRLIDENEKLKSKVDELKKMNDKLMEEKQDEEKKLKFIKADVVQLKNENKDLRKKVK